MATTYQTIPTEPTTAPEKSRKGLVFRAAVASFVLGMVAATAVSAASKPTGAIAFSKAAPGAYEVQCPRPEYDGGGIWPTTCDVRYDCHDNDKESTSCNCHDAWEACDAIRVQRQRQDWWGTCDWIESNSNTDGEQPVKNIDGTDPSSPLECIALVKEQYPDATIAKSVDYGSEGCWAQYGSSKPVADGSGYRSCVLASLHEQDLKSFKFVDAEDGILDHGSLYKAVDLWLEDRDAAEKLYGHISNWDTSRITTMRELFSENKDFNDDISAWDTSQVTDMNSMFDSASAFNQPIGDWKVAKVKDMTWFLSDASAFNQKLDWCVDADASLDGAFEDTKCESTSCGVLHTAALSCGGTPMGDGSIRTAVAAWFLDPTTAEATYGHIKDWDTSGVTDMKNLFCAGKFCNFAAALFNEDISAWDTSGVTTMQSMFENALAFDQPIGDWRVDKVTSMYEMFQGAGSFNQGLSGWNVEHADLHKMFLSAESFDQHLGWCLNNPEDRMSDSFEGAGCESNSCGVHSNETYVEFEAHMKEEGVYRFSMC